MGASCGVEEDMSPRRKPTAAKLQNKSFSDQFQRIADRFESLEDLQNGLRQVGLESSNCM
jgi:hypothetical protein